MRCTSRRAVSVTTLAVATIAQDTKCVKALAVRQCSAPNVDSALRAILNRGGATCENLNTISPFGFERTSKRRKGFPSETQVKRGTRVVGGTKELVEKLGRNDLCPCGSRRRF